MKKITTIMAVIAAVAFIGTTANAELNIGGDIKVLGFYGENTADFNDDGSYYDKQYYYNGDDQDDFMRVEAHIWFHADLSENVTTKVSIEADRDFDYDTENVDDDVYYSSDNTDDLAIFLEEAWIQIAYLYDSNFSAKLGRQFIQLGDGFVVGDGNPYSEMYLIDLGEYEVDPFDAINVWYDGDDWVLNLIAAKTVETRTWDEDADLYVIYFSYTGVENYVFDLYGLMENYETNSFLGYGEEDGEVYAIGARIWGNPVEGLTFKIEGLYEFGDIDFCGDDADLKAWAVEAGIKYEFDAEYNPFVGFTVVYMSGDDDNDGDIETYDPLFINRTYGEIFDPFTEWGNIFIFNLSGGFDVSEDIAIGAKGYYFMADEEEMWGNDDDLGWEVDLYLDYQFSEETKAILSAGCFIPEDGVEDYFGKDDTAFYVRGGVEVEF